MEPLSFSTSDLCLHVAKFGLDVYPPIEIPNERTRLNIFYEEARERWPVLFDQLIASDTEFKISKGFRRRPEVSGPSAALNTFVLTNRGPVFAFPLLLPEPVGETGLEETYLEQFQQVRTLFFSALPDRKVLRLGLIRDLVFGTGERGCQGMVTAQDSFGRADLVGGKCLVRYRDPRCNVRVELESVELMKATQLPVGTTVTQRDSYGLRVQLDVNNLEIRPLEDSDIREVIERATSLWPDELLRYLNERKAS